MNQLFVATGLALAAVSVQAVEINVGDLLKKAIRDAQAKQAQQAPADPAVATAASIDAKAAAAAPGTAGALTGKTYKDSLELSRQLQREGLQDEQSFNLGAPNSNTWISSYVSSTGGRRILLTKKVGSGSQVVADLALNAVPKGTQLVGSSELGPDADGDGADMICTLNGKKGIAFGYMKRNGKVFTPTKSELAWNLDAHGNPIPLTAGVKLACK